MPSPRGAASPALTPLSCIRKRGAVVLLTYGIFMSLAFVYSRACVGIKAPLVTVEAHISHGLPSFSIVGLPEAAVKESKDRVRSAIINSHFDFPCRRITINLGPADLPKEGGRYDLPIALGILAATEQIPKVALADYEFAGELALSGELHPVQAVLTLAIGCAQANRKLILPQENAYEAALAEAGCILPARHLLDVCAHLLGKSLLAYYQKTSNSFTESLKNKLDISDVKGQQHAKRALLIAAAGGHNMLMIGPPGAGKTMIASRLPTILPKLSEHQALEVAAIRSISGKVFDPINWRSRPFRNPHHTASSVALVGGGSPPKPGEISLAHGGVLFLDELPEFNRHVLEALREPLESGLITISRAAQQCEYPAKFQLIAAMNPCPCGYLGSLVQQCRCSVEQVQRYRAKISGPLLDRIDLHVEVKGIATHLFIHHAKADTEETSAMMIQKVAACLDRQLQRQGSNNAQLSSEALQKYCTLTSHHVGILEQGINQLKLSCRSAHRILKIARTLADLEGRDAIAAQDLHEAFSYRMLRG
jgi:magnesium chelatase family protein